MDVWIRYQWEGGTVRIWGSGWPNRRPAAVISSGGHRIPTVFNPKQFKRTVAPASHGAGARNSHSPRTLPSHVAMARPLARRDRESRPEAFLSPGARVIQHQGQMSSVSGKALCSCLPHALLDGAEGGEKENEERGNKGQKKEQSN
jgi:hypothetical protein